MPRRRAITAEDLLRFRFVSDPRISPDGSEVLYVVKWIEGKKYRTQLWIGERPFTSSSGDDAFPRWSSDGKTIAFVRTAEDDAQIWLIGRAGGEARPVTKLPPGKIKALEWSPDGTRLAFVFHPGAKEKEPPLLRHVTRLRYKEEGAGFLDSERDHIWIVQARDGRTEQITRGDWDDACPAWSPDSRRIAFVSNRLPDADYRLLEFDVWIVGSGGGVPRKLPKPAGPASHPVWSPDGKTIAFLGHDQPEESWGGANTHVWTAAADGRRPARDILRGFDRTCEDLVITDTRSFHGAGQPPVWSGDGREIYFLASDRGACHIYQARAAGGRPEPLTRGQIEVTSFTEAGRRMAAAVSDPLTIGEICTLELPGRARSGRPLAAERRARGTRAPGGRTAGGPTEGGRSGAYRLERVSALNDALWGELKLARPLGLSFTSFDGARIQGWLLRPPDRPRGRKRPAIVQIHGGPRAQYGCAFFHEFQLLAAMGYAVFYCNPRGSQGYGEAFTKAIRNDWGNLDYRDIMAGVDALERQPGVDSRRLGVCGGSYGGYMTNWILGNTRRFRAAITMRSVTNLFSMFGTSDFGYEDSREFGGHAFDDPANYARQSPITYVKRIRTPLLILHAEGDLRCPIEQAEQLYTMLKAMKRKVEFIRFPEENHDLSRAGRPDRRIERLRRIQAWWRRYLGS